MFTGRARTEVFSVYLIFVTLGEKCGLTSTTLVYLVQSVQNLFEITPAVVVGVNKWRNLRSFVRPHKNIFWFHYKSRRFVLPSGRTGDMMDFQDSPGKSGRLDISGIVIIHN